MFSTECDTCWYYDYDEEYEEYYCMMDLDEDEVYRIMTSRSQHCPYYRQGDVYTLARRQYDETNLLCRFGLSAALRLRRPGSR